MQQYITDNLDILFNVLPPHISEAVHAANQNEKLLEIVLDLGRKPEARYTDSELMLSEQEVTQSDSNRQKTWKSEKRRRFILDTSMFSTIISPHKPIYKAKGGPDQWKASPYPKDRPDGFEVSSPP